MPNNEIRLNTRLLLRYDSYENWMATKPVLLAGEVAVATIANQEGNTSLNHNSVALPQVLIKVGDGTSSYDLLPFASALAADVHPWAKETQAQFENRVKTLVAGLKFASAADLDALEALVGTLPEGATATTVVGYIGEVKTALSAEIDADVKVVADDLAGYKTTNNEALAGVKATAEAAVTDAKLATALEPYATKTEAQGYADAKDEAIAAAKKAGDDAQADVNALAALVGTLPEDTTAETIVAYVDAKTADIASSEAMTQLTNRVTTAEEAIDAIEADYVKAADIANFETKENVKTVADNLAAYEEANDAAVALKADKSVVDAMYTNTQIDGFIADAKKYADDNDANTTYTIGYESKVDGEGGHPARIVLTPSEGEAQYVDATPFIKDGMLDNVAYNADTNTLTFTFNTDAGKEAVTVELTDILAPYTGSTGDRVKVEVTDGVISADLVAGSISKDYLDASIKASLALADSALQEHQNIDHLATKEELKAVSDVADAARTEAEVDDQIDAKIAELDLANTYEAKGAAATAETNAKDYADDLNTAMDTRVLALENNNANYATKTEAQSYATAAQTAAEGKVTELANGAVAANTAAIVAINNAESGILAQAKQHTNDEIAKLSATDGALTVLGNRVKANEDKLAGIDGTVIDAINAAKAGIATTTAAGLVKASDAVTVAEDGTMGIAKVSTDVLFNGNKEFVLYGGTADGFTN